MEHKTNSIIHKAVPLNIRSPFMSAAFSEPLEPLFSEIEQEVEQEQDLLVVTLPIKVFGENFGMKIAKKIINPLTQNPEINPSGSDFTIVFPPRKRLCVTSEWEARTQKLEDPLLVLVFFNYIRKTSGTDISDVKLVMKRSLESTDVHPQHARLAIPLGKIETSFLTKSEEGRLLKRDKEDKFKVKVFGSYSFQEHKLEINQWDYAANKNKEKVGWKYVLNAGWNQFVAENNLKVGQFIELYSFRREGMLCFAIVCLQKYEVKIRKTWKRKKPQNSKARNKMISTV